MTTLTYLTPAEAGIKVGDYFYASWGYDQTNINYFRVVALTPKCVKIQEVESTVVKDNGPQVYVAPTPKPKETRTRDYDYDTGLYGDETVTVAPVQTKRIKSWTPGRYSLAWESYADLYPWDGGPKYQTGSGWGH